jgi:hypothetical protein
MPAATRWPDWLVAGDGDANDLIAGRDGDFHGNTATGSGLVNLAFRLDGEGDFVEVPHDPALNVGISDFTVDLWVNFNDTSGEQVLIEKWIPGDGYVDGWLDEAEQPGPTIVDSGGGNEAAWIRKN